MKRKITKQSFTLQFMSWEISMLFYFLSFLGIISHALDIITLNDENPTILLQNIPVIIILSINAIVSYFKWMSKSVALNVLIYSLVISITVSFVFFTIHDPQKEIIFLRNNLFVSLLMIVATLFNGKHHLYIISGIFWVGSISVISHFSSTFLENYGILIFIVYFSFAFLVYHFYDILENILGQKERDATIIHNQNAELKSMLDKYQNISEEAKRQNEQINLKNRKLLRQEEKLKLANATKDKFFSIIAHDLKNPLNVITTLTDLLENHYDTSEEAKKRKYISLINESSKLLYRLLENLLEWSRSQTGKLKLKPQIFNIDELIYEEIVHTKTFAAQKLIALQAGKVESVKVNADLQMMSAVLRNLVSNAIKFSQERTTVTISVVKDDDNRVKIMVQDEGIGIHPEEQYKLFILDESYTRYGTKGETSTGLGLLLCKDFVEKNGGNIGVESDVDKGSVFWFTIPVFNSN